MLQSSTLTTTPQELPQLDTDKSKKFKDIYYY